MEKDLLVSTKDRVCVITINRPQARNALTIELIKQINQAVQNAGSNSNIGCILIRGSGEEAFCAGADLNELSSRASLKDRTDFFSNLATLLETLHKSATPIVAMVHGYAMAGGLGLVSCSDLVLASDKSIYALPELKIGMVPMIVMAALEGVIGKRALSYLALTCEQIDSAEALRIGLVSRIFPSKVLEIKSLEIAKNIASRGPKTTSVTRATLNQISSPSFETELNTRAKRIALLSLDPETQEGIQAYIEKRKPNWKHQ